MAMSPRKMMAMVDQLDMAKAAKMMMGWQS